MSRVANRECRWFVQSKSEFTGSHLFARRIYIKRRWFYVVYSYGQHWPLFISERIYRPLPDTLWYENSTQPPSRATARHLTQAHPQTSTIKKDVSWMRELLNGNIDLLNPTSQSELLFA
jgi:hypothetical protein